MSKAVGLFDFMVIVAFRGAWASTFFMGVIVPIISTAKDSKVAFSKCFVNFFLFICVHSFHLLVSQIYNIFIINTIRQSGSELTPFCRIVHCG